MDTYKNDMMIRLLDYRLGRDSAAEHEATGQWIQSDPAAAKLDAQLAAMLDALGQWEVPEVPADLTGKTVQFVRANADTSQAVPLHLFKRRDRSQDRSVETTSRWLFRTVRDLAAVAACLLFLVLAVQPRWRTEDRRNNNLAAELTRSAPAGSSSVADIFSDGAAVDKPVWRTLDQMGGRTPSYAFRGRSPLVSHQGRYYMQINGQYIPVDVSLGSDGRPRQVVIRPELLEHLKALGTAPTLRPQVQGDSNIGLTSAPIPEGR